MMKAHIKRAKRIALINKAVRTVSFVMLLKGVVAGSFAMLALVGVAVPHFFGVDPTVGQEGAAAGAGAILGAILAIKS
jgi:hypothetical protein